MDCVSDVGHRMNGFLFRFCGVVVVGEQGEFWNNKLDACDRVRHGDIYRTNPLPIAKRDEH